ncbi:MAG: PilT/PilU family type 4a pilus ATPase [Pyrinomonadaceae bacterium]|nr:PilT/PilU family type 4a pilus ATPase [Pyrinomonadaceae bacterium]MDQ3585579.1 PilT/PilU family type 4a pilus ATPase [Acidobacteriota bacterium]
MSFQTPPTTNVAESAAPLNFINVLRAMLGVSDKVSDLIFSPGRPPQIELMGKLQPVSVAGLEKLMPAHTAAIAKLLIGSQQVAADNLSQYGSADVSFSAPGLSRFRVNVFMQRGTHVIVMRVIPSRPPQWSDFNLPEAIKQIVDLKTGLVLVTGPTGSGKSSTLAAVIDLINETKFYHVITIEDPIEFLHQHKNCTIHQRELHTDTPDFARALRAALRQAPKVILVGEMRDRETIEIALEAAETGHLVLSTLHTIDASKTVDRIIGVFPKNEEKVIRARLANVFRVIVSQRLLPRADGKGRVAAIEILQATSRTRQYIEQGEAEGKSLLDAMEQGALEGMQTFDSVIEGMIREGIVNKDEALSYASNIGNLQLRLADYGGSAAAKPVPQNGHAGSMLNMIE